MKISVAVMAHPSRRHLVEELLPAVPGAEVVLDRYNDRWDTGRRSMLAHGRTISWHLVIQDDALPCRDFLAGVEAALKHVPPGCPVSFYTGRARPHGPAVKAAVNKAKKLRRAWLEMRGPLWGPAVAVPGHMIESMVEGCDKLTRIPNYDLRMTHHFAGLGIKCWYSVPSLVDHRVGPENPSLVIGRGAGLTRVAQDFIGDRSPLKINWKTEPLQVELKELFERGAPVRVAEERIYGLDAHGRRVLVAAKGQPVPRGFNIQAEKQANSKKRKPKPKVSYAGLKQPELKRLLDERGIEYPKGPVRNAKLIELLG